MSLMRRGALFAGALFAGALFGPLPDEAQPRIPAFDAPAAFAAPRPRAHVQVLRAAALAREAEWAGARACLAQMAAASAGERESAISRAVLIMPSGAAESSASRFAAIASATLDYARIAALDDESLAAGLLG